MDSLLLHKQDTIASLSYNVAHLAGNTCFSVGWICHMHVNAIYGPYKFIPYSCFPIVRSVSILICHVYQQVFRSGLLTRIFFEFVVSQTCYLPCLSYLWFYYPINVWWNTNCETLLYIIDQDLFCAAISTSCFIDKLMTLGKLTL